MLPSEMADKIRSISTGVELPEYTEADNNKVLTVVESDLAWKAVTQKQELPEVTSNDFGKILKANRTGTSWEKPILYNSYVEDSGVWIDNGSIFKITKKYDTPIELAAGTQYTSDILSDNIKSILTIEAIASDGATLQLIDALRNEDYVCYVNNYHDTVKIKYITLTYISTILKTITFDKSNWSITSSSGWSTYSIIDDEESTILKSSHGSSRSADRGNITWQLNKGIDLNGVNKIEIIANPTYTGSPDWAYGMQKNMIFSCGGISQKVESYFNTGSYQTLTLNVSSLTSTEYFTVSASYAQEYSPVNFEIHIKEIRLYGEPNSETINDRSYLLKPYTSEEWTFTLSDGTTVTKKVHIDG